LWWSLSNALLSTVEGINGINLIRASLTDEERAAIDDGITLYKNLLDRLALILTPDSIDSALKSLKPFALSLSKGQFIKGLRLAQPERS
jgi:hypothetical protein